MFIDRIELENFKSFNGYQTIGEFKNFTSVVGPNGAGLYWYRRVIIIIILTLR